MYNINIKKAVVLTLLFAGVMLKSMDSIFDSTSYDTRFLRQNNRNIPRGIHYVTIHGLNNYGGEDYKRVGIINKSQGNTYTFCNVPTNSSTNDLGQSKCQNHFSTYCLNSIKLNESDPIVLSAIGMSVQTLLCSFERMPDKVKNNISLMVLESSMASTYSAIMHSGYTQYPLLRYVPFSSHLIRNTVERLYPACDPSCTRTALSCVEDSQVPKEIPVILIHTKDNMEVDINDARKLYCALKKNGNDVYLMEIEGITSYRSIERAGSNGIYISAAIQQIYKNKKLPYNPDLLKQGMTKASATEINLAEFQPSIADVQKRITAQ